MDECELACDRIGIMVAGQFKCLGSLQHLKNKFGTGYSLNLRLEDGSAVDLDAFVAEVQRVFPGIQLRARHEVCTRGKIGQSCDAEPAHLSSLTTRS